MRQDTCQVLNLYNIVTLECHSRDSNIINNNKYGCGCMQAYTLTNLNSWWLSAVYVAFLCPQPQWRHQVTALLPLCLVVTPTVAECSICGVPLSSTSMETSSNSAVTSVFSRDTRLWLSRFDSKRRR